MSVSRQPHPTTERRVTARHLRVVDDAPTFSALPHVVVFDNTLSAGARLLYAVLQSYWWKTGECFASADTLAENLGVSERQIRRYLGELIDARHIVERQHGRGRSKAYAPRVSESHQKSDTGVRFEAGNRTPTSDFDRDVSGKRTPASDLAREDGADSEPKADTSVQGKRTNLSAPLRRLPEEDLPDTGVDRGGVVAADAAPPPKPSKMKPRASSKAPKSEVTTAPDAIDLTDRHLAYAAEYGFHDPVRVRAITDHFLSHHRFLGTRGKDWYAGWQGWIRRQRDIDDERAARRGGPTRGGKPWSGSPHEADMPSTAHLVQETEV